MGLLEGKRLLVTGVLTDHSIAFHVARLAQQEGAQVVLTSFGRQFRLAQAIAKRLPAQAPVVELDVTDASTSPRSPTGVREHVDHIDGVLHSIGFAPQSVWAATSSAASGRTSPRPSQVSAFSLKSLAVAAKPLMPRWRPSSV